MASVVVLFDAVCNETDARRSCRSEKTVSVRSRDGVFLASLGRTHVFGVIFKCLFRDIAAHLDGEREEEVDGRG